MSHPARKTFASLLLVALVFFQFAPLTIHADDAVAPADTAAASTPSDAPSANATTAPDAGTGTSDQTGSADAGDAAATQSETVATSDQNTAAADQQAGTGTTDAADTASSSDSDAAVNTTAASTTTDANSSSESDAAPQAAAAVSAPTGDPSSDPATADSTSSSSASSSSDSTSAASSTVEATSTGASAGEQHDDLSVHATSTDPAFSINGVLDQINDIASTSSAGPVSNSGGGGGSVADVSTDTPALDFHPEVATTSDPDATASTTSSALSQIGSSTPTIVSGAATAIANILNILNSTFVNSQGAILFQNFTDQAGTIDFRNPALFLGLCGTASCSGSSGLQINLLQDGTIDNNIFISANSGENTLQSNTDGAILSGNALAGLNLINMANVTVANSNYLLIALNAFRGVNGDIIFPALADFFAPLLGAENATQVAGLNNSATVDNDVTTGANAGDNTASTSENGTSSILTGSAAAHTNVFNQINSLLAGSGLSVLFRISGDWAGEVQGLPAGVTWIRTPEGILITGNATGTESLGPVTTISGTSTADIQNHAQVGALTGANDISASTTALISTGDALAGANIINIANQTVVGRNWILAIINIFGDFTGNIAFGEPDLWVGSQVQAPGTIHPGDTLSYKVTVINNGDAQATLAKLKETFDSSRIKILDASLPFTANGSDMLFDLGTLAPGAAKEITYTAQVTNFASGDAIVSQSNALLHENDNNPADNTDSTRVQDVAVSGGGGGGGFGYGYTGPVTPAATTTATSTATVHAPAILKVTRTTPTITVQAASTTATEILTIENTSDVPALGVKLNDVIRDGQGADMHEEMFDIGTLAPHEEVSITYDLTFHEMGRGRYTLWSEIGGENVGAQIYQNGDITFLSAELPAPVFPVAPAAAHAISAGAIRPIAPDVSEPLVPNTGNWTDAVEAAAPSDNLGQTAGAGSVDGDVSDMYMKLVSFGLLLLSIFGALRAFVFRM